MTNVFLFHGIHSHPNDNYHKWLREQLESLGCRVIAPQFPTPGQALDNWLTVFERHLDHWNQDTLADGHSLGAILELKILQMYRARIKAAFMNAVYIGVPPKVSYEGQETFEREPYDWKVVRERSEAFHVFYSDNDSQVGPGNGLLLAQNLGVEPIFVQGAGHFNTQSGYTRFELLLEKMKPYIVTPKTSA